MAAQTLTSLIAATRDLVGDPSNAGTGANRYTDPQVTDALNYACQDACTKKNYTYVENQVFNLTSVTNASSTFSLASLTKADGTTVSGLDYVVIKRVMTGGVIGASTVPKVELLKSSVLDEDLRSPSWRSAAAGTPRRWVLQDGSTIVVTPAFSATNAVNNSAQAVYLVTVGYTQQPSILAVGTDTVDSRIPWAVQIYLKYAAAAWLKEFSGQDEQDLNQSNLWKAAFNSFIDYKG